MYPGYTSGKLMGLYTYITDSNGDCIATGGTTGLQYNLRFNLESKIVCKSTNNSINLFSAILGAQINKYYLDNTNKITIPSISSTFT